MFLGPLEQSKPWDTNGIEGVHKFLRKTWRLFFNRDGLLLINEEEPDEKELKVLHKVIKKIQEDVENFSFNTSVSAFMIAVNELGTLSCNKRKILEPLLICLSPFAPHMCEELWEQCGHKTSITVATYPEYNAKYLTEDSFEYPVSFNGKTRFKLNIPLNIPNAEIEKAAMSSPETQKWLEGKNPKKVIIVPGKIINIVI
jgi:leucyl-tRNA synthetase